MSVTLRLDFPTPEACQTAQRALLESGIPENAITQTHSRVVAAPEAASTGEQFEVSPDPAVSEGAEHTPQSAAIGIAVGGAIGAAIGAVATPVIGPVGVAAGLGVGAYAGSLVGALSGFESDEEQAIETSPTETSLRVRLEHGNDRTNVERIAQLFGATTYDNN